MTDENRAREAVKRFRVRRAVRLGIETSQRYDSVEQYRRRRAERMGIHLDADDEETGGKKKGGHGNTKLPFGLCEREGIEVQKGWTPEDAWKALEGKGYSAGESYKELKKTGKVSSKGQKPEKKDYAGMDYDTLSQEYDDLNRRYKEAEEREKNRERDMKTVSAYAKRVKMVKDLGDYHGETYEDLERFLESDEDEDHSLHSVMKKAMDMFGHDVFEKDMAEVEKMAESKIKELSEPANFAGLNEERESIRNELANKARAKYKKLSDCDSAAALEARIMSDDFFESGEWLKDQIDYREMDAESASGVGKGLEILKKRFPKLKGMLKPPLMSDQLSGSAYAQCEIDPFRGDAQVMLNKYKFQDTGYMKACLKADVKTGFHPKGTANVQSTVTHEYGHAIDDLLSRRFEKELGRKKFSEYVLDKIASENNVGRTEVMSQVSRYSVNNRAPVGMEFLAEAFSEYCCSSKPRPIAVQVGQIMAEYINRL